jgi:2',3'-cyclic-nucleotide 2'-phosphodiesterase (5'-nucleotidase family)
VSEPCKHDRAVRGHQHLPTPAQTFCAHIKRLVAEANEWGQDVSTCQIELAIAHLEEES